MNHSQLDMPEVRGYFAVFEREGLLDNVFITLS